MRNGRKTIAAVTAAIMTAASVPGVSVFAGENAGSDSGFVSTSGAAAEDNDASVISDKELAEKLAQLIKQGDQLKYGEALYKTGTPEGERWAEEFYWQRIEFYGEEFLAKYIVNGEFLREKAEADRAAILEKNRTYESETTDAINEYLRSNSIAGYAVIRKTDGVEKIFITYDGHLDKIKEYIAEKGIDESSVVYEQSHDDIVYATQAVTTYPNHCTGDVNGDGSFTIADAILFQRWLLSVPDAELPDWKAADMNSDNRLDVFDFCIMKQELIKKMPVVSYPEKGNIDLTLDDVVRLAKKGDELTWSDFKNYKSRDIGSGLYIEKYDLEDDYTLLVGGVPDRKPDYILLYHHGNDKEAIDIRTDDVQMYLDSEVIADGAAACSKVSVSLYPSGRTTHLDSNKTEKLLSIISGLELTESDDSYLAFSGQSVKFIFTDNNKKETSFSIADKNLVIDGRGYKCSGDTASELRKFGVDCLSYGDETVDGAVYLRLDDVVKLARKGDELTWSDFKDYKSTDIGSGLYIDKYDLEDDYTLLVGGVPDRKPDYILLYHHGKDKEAIDIRTEDVQKYLDNEMIADMASMSVKEIDAAELNYYPSGKTIKLRKEQTEDLISLLNLVTLTERSDMYMAWSGSSVSFTVSGNGRSRSFEVVDSYIVINERGYKADSKRIAQLNELASTVSAVNPTISEFAQPLGFGTVQEAENQIYNYDVASAVLEQYPEKFRYDYRKMFSRIKSDNYLPVVSIDDDSAEVNTAPNQFALILFPEAQFEDIGIGSYVKFNNNIYYVTYSYADEDVLTESSGIADYLKKRTGRRTDKTVTVKGKEASLFNNADVQTYVSAFVDDTHYCTVVGSSEKGVMQVFEALSFEERSFEKDLMTKNDVIELSKKGSELRVSDFESFRSSADWTDSGKLGYEVEGTSFVVIVDAADAKKAPEYVSLFSSISSYGESIDIRNEDMESFFADPPFKVY